MGDSQQLRGAHSLGVGCSFMRALSLCTCLILIGTESLLAQNASSCSSSDWFVVQQTQREGSRLSPLCKGELDAAEDHREAAEAELKAVIAGSPQSADAYAAHSTLTHFYLRIGRFHDANAEILAMLATRPAAPDLHNVRSLFALLASTPDLAVVSSQPATVRTHVIDGNVFAPLTIEGSTRTYMLDTGLSLSMMSESEAKSLGLNPQSSTTSVSDISGLNGPGARIVQVDRLVIGATELRHVPFLVVADTNGAFVGIPPDQHGILGIQPLLALGTLSFRKDGALHIGESAEQAHITTPLLFDGALPLSQIVYQGRPLTVTFDMGATQTTLDPPFVKLYPEVLKQGKSESHTMNGISGSTAQRSVSLPHLELIFGRQVDLSPATILLDETTGASAYAAANLGYDLMQQARPFTIDFHHMLITFAAEH
jgi:hypothetical protein